MGDVDGQRVVSAGCCGRQVRVAGEVSKAGGRVGTNLPDITPENIECGYGWDDSEGSIAVP